jgi:hypothetical protein
MHAKPHLLFSAVAPLGVKRKSSTQHSARSSGRTDGLNSAYYACTYVA